MHVICVLAYFQEVGRCGRDGLQAEAVMFFNSNDIATNVAHMSTDMREYCLLSTCLRSYIMNYFGDTDAINDRVLHLCCSNCALLCTCEFCKI